MTSGEIHDVSLRIGALTAAVQNLERRGDEDRKTQADRHDENQAAIEDLRRTLDAMVARAAIPVIPTSPLSLTPPQRIALISIALALLTGAVWLIEHVFGAALSWILSHLKP